MGPTLTQKEFVNLKSRLTRAKNSNDPQRVLKEAEHALSIFEEKGYPDNWHLWQAAKEQAQSAIGRGYKTYQP